MNNNGKKTSKRKIIIVCTIVLSVLYIFLAQNYLGEELHFTPEWTEDISHVQQVSGDVELISYKLGQNIGYFTPDGKIASQITFPFKASISDSYYTTYYANSSSITLFSKTGEETAKLNAYGFPYFQDDRIFMMLPGGSSFAVFNKFGDKKWQYESYAPITAFSSSPKGTVAGYADGTLIAFNEKGTITQKFQPGGSSISVINGAAISKDGSTVACVSGQNPQRFVIAKDDTGHSKIVFHEYLEKDFLQQCLVQFSRNDSLVFYNYNGGLGIADLEKLRSSHIKIPGTIVQIQESDTNNLIFVLSKDKKQYTVTVIEPFDHPSAHFSFTADSAFLQAKGNSVFVGRDNKISRLTVSIR